RRADQASDRHRCYALAGTAFANETKRLALGHAEGYAVDGFDDALICEEISLEILHFENAIRFGHLLLASPWRARIRSAHLSIASPWRARIRSAHALQASRYSPWTRRKASEISPTLA